MERVSESVEGGSDGVGAAKGISDLVEGGVDAVEAAEGVSDLTGGLRECIGCISELI